MGKRPTLTVGDTFRIRFIDSTGNVAYETTLTIGTTGDRRASAIHAYISRWIRHGRYRAEIERVDEQLDESSLWDSLTNDYRD